MTDTKTCAVLKRKKIVFRVRRVFGGFVVFVSWVRRVRRRRQRLRCVFRAADGKLATPRTGSTVMRCLGGRNIDPVGPRRTSCATLQRLTTKNPSSKKKKKNPYNIYTQQNAHHHYHGGGDFIKDWNPSDDDQDEFLVLFLCPSATKRSKSVLEIVFTNLLQFQIPVCR